MNTEASYHVAKDGQTLGPFSAETIGQYLREGRLASTDHLFDAASQSWVPISEIAFESTTPPPIPDKAANMTAAAPKIWNPSAAANWSLLFSPLFGQIIHLLNWKALGDTKQIPQTPIWIIVSCALLIGNALTPPEFSLSGVFILYLIIWYFVAARRQIRVVKNSFGGNYPKKGWIKPLGLGVLGFIVYLVFVVVCSTVLYGSRSSRAADLPAKSEEILREDAAARKPEASSGGSQSMSESQPEPQREPITVKGELPMSFTAAQPYVIDGLFLLQNIDGGWLVDLIPSVMLENFPRQKDETGMLFNTILQDYIGQGIYQVGKQRVILIPANKNIYDQVNLPEQRTILKARGKFLKFHTFETTTGATARVPVFMVDLLELWSGEKIDLK